MKTILLAALPVLALMTVPAFAESEGNGDPFPFRANGAITLTGPASAGLAQGAPTVQRNAKVAVQTAEAGREANSHRLR